MNQDFETALNEWLKRAQKIVDESNKKLNFSSLHTVLSIDPKGQKYVRIVRSDNYGGQSVHCFIEKNTGNVLKAESWARPAVHARGSIFETGKEGVSAYGGFYLR